MIEQSPTTTPERILAAAGEIFGRDGFKAATIRRIAEAAQANIAAINYHFGDKEGLYSAVLEDLFKRGFDRFPADMGLRPGAAPEDRLHAFIRSMLYRLLSNNGWAGLCGPSRLIARELLEPTPSFEPIIEKYIRPHKDILIAIIRDLLGGRPSAETLASCALSIIGQCIYYAFGAAVIRKFTEYSRPTEESLDRIAEFVWQFSLGGISRMREGQTLGSET